MIKRSELVAKMALWTGADHDDVHEIARRLAEGGHMSLGRPGRYGGAAQTARDAGNLLSAVASGENGIRAARKFEQLQSMKSCHASSNDNEDEWNIGKYFEFFRIQKSDKLSDAIIKIIYSYSRGFSKENQEVQVVFRFPELYADISFNKSDAPIDASISYNHEDFQYPTSNSEGASVDLDAWFMKKHGFFHTCKIETERTIYGDIFLFLGRLLVNAPEPWQWDAHPWSDRREYLENPDKPWMPGVLSPGH